MKAIFTFSLFFCFFTMQAQEKIYLYPSTQKVTNDGYEKDKEPPYVDYFKASPELANGSAVLICPGGAYTNLADQHEGADVAKFFNDNGFDAFVLHYRLNNFEQQGHRFPDQYNDVTTAMRMVKSRAKEWKINPEKIGVLGFSAGGHLASMCATMHLPSNKKSKNGLEQQSSRPAFAVLIYPVIDLAGKAAHNYSREMLLGKNPDNELVDSLSTYNRVDEHTPPTFLVYSNDDNAVPPENGLLFYNALRQHNIQTSLHIYDHGGHGYGMAPKDPVLNTWPSLCIDWLKRLGYGSGKK
jgi:acetyl esterase/lipase